MEAIGIYDRMSEWRQLGIQRLKIKEAEIPIKKGRRI